MFSLIATVLVNGDVTKRATIPSQSPQPRKNSANTSVFRLVKRACCQILFCQQSLTQNLFQVQNKDNYFFQKMGNLGKFGDGLKVLAAATMLTGAAEAQEAQGENIVLAAQTGTVGQVEDCGVFVREQRELARANNIEMTRRQGLTLLVQCENGEMVQIVEAQNQILAALNTEIAEIGLRINDQAQIIDDQGRELATIVAINGQLVIRIAEIDTEIASIQADRAALQADTAAKLAQAEAILQRLATS